MNILEIVGFSVLIIAAVGFILWGTGIMKVEADFKIEK